MSDYGATDLVRHAEQLLGTPGAETAGRWPRAVALLGRQAVEAALTQLWRAVAQGLELCSARAQLLCLPAYIDPELAKRATHAWSSLSEACHYHPYELAPIADELVSWLAVAGELATAVAEAAA